MWESAWKQNHIWGVIHAVLNFKQLNSGLDSDGDVGGESSGEGRLEGGERDDKNIILQILQAHLV